MKNDFSRLRFVPTQIMAVVKEGVGEGMIQLVKPVAYERATVELVGSLSMKSIKEIDQERKCKREMIKDGGLTTAGSARVNKIKDNYFIFVPVEWIGMHVRITPRYTVNYDL